MQEKKMRTSVLTALVCLACSGTAFAATDVTAVDIQQLEKAPGLVLGTPAKAKAYEQETVDAAGNVTMSISDKAQAAATTNAEAAHADAAAIMKMPLRWQSVEEPFRAQQEKAEAQKKAEAQQQAAQKQAAASHAAQKQAAASHAAPQKLHPIILTADDLPQLTAPIAPPRRETVTPQPTAPITPPRQETALPHPRKPALSWHATHGGHRHQPPVRKHRPQPPMQQHSDVRRALPPKAFRPLPVPKNVRLAAIPDERALPATDAGERPEPFRDISASSWRHIQAGIYAMQLQLRTDISEPAIFHFVQILCANTGLTHLQKLQYLIGFGYAINHSRLSDWQKGALIGTIAQSFH